MGKEGEGRGRKGKEVIDVISSRGILKQTEITAVLSHDLDGHPISMAVAHACLVTPNAWPSHKHVLVWLCSILNTRTLTCGLAICLPKII